MLPLSWRSSPTIMRVLRSCRIKAKGTSTVTRSVAAGSGVSAGFRWQGGAVIHVTAPWGVGRDNPEIPAGPADTPFGSCTAKSRR
jgi:hypothetical protein